MNAQNRFFSLIRADLTPARPMMALRSFANRTMAFARGLLGSQHVACNNSEASGDERTSISAINESIAGDQEWVRIAPYRVIPNRVGPQVVDREAADRMVSAFNSISGRLKNFFRGLPGYEGHVDDPEWAKQHPGVSAESVLRIKELEARDDGLYGRVVWNEKGRKLVGGDAPAYAFHSPRWGMLPIVHNGKKAFRPVQLFSIGLTNQPNIEDNAIGLNEADGDRISEPMKSHLIKLLAALGKTVAADATEEQVTAAINEALPIAEAGVVATNEAPALKTQLTTAQNEATTLKTQLADQKTAASNERAARVKAVLVVAINSGLITEAQRPEWESKLVTASDFGAVQGELEALKPAVNTRAAAAGLGGRKGEQASSGKQITAINEAIRKHCAEKNLDPRRDWNTAYAAVKASQPALFVTTNS